jgi:hypothetical protein
LKSFYDDVTNVVKASYFNRLLSHDHSSWVGLSLYEIGKNKFSYPVGVDKINKFSDFTVTKDTKVKYWNAYDGHEIDIDRMLDDLDFLQDTRKVRNLPKTADIYINVSEASSVSYEDMLCKTYSAIKIADKLETIGVRCAIYACASLRTNTNQQRGKEEVYIEVAVKQHADALNIGVLCAAISPWMLRHWFILFITGHYYDIDETVGTPQRMPPDLKGIIIDTGMCLNMVTANKFIESIKM